MKKQVFGLLCLFVSIVSEKAFAGVIFTERFTSQNGALGLISLGYIYNPIQPSVGLGVGGYFSIGNEQIRSEFGVEFLARSTIESLSTLSSQTVLRVGRQNLYFEDKSFMKLELQHTFNHEIQIPSQKLGLFVGGGVLLRGAFGVRSEMAQAFQTSDVAPVIQVGAIF